MSKRCDIPKLYGRIIIVKSENLYEITRMRLETPSGKAFINGDAEKTVFECTADVPTGFSLSMPCRVSAAARYVFRSGFAIMPQALDSYDLIFIHLGCVRVSTGSGFYYARPGDAVFIHTCGKTAVNQEGDSPLEITVLRANGFLCTSFFELLGGDRSSPITSSETDSLLALVEKIVYYMSYPTNLNSVLMANIISQLFTALYISLNDSGKRDKTYDHPEWFVDTVAYIEKNFASNISINELAERVFISESRFYRIFKEYTGLSPYQYITKVRMMRAQRLLTDTELQVKNIALTVGYNSVNHFISHFKEFSGMTPSEYKNSTFGHKLLM